MKKFKKILLSMCCFIMLITSCLCLTACDVAGNTKDAVNTTTDLVPYEYSQAAATNILTSAYANSLQKDFYKSIHTGKVFANGIEVQVAPTYESYYFTKDNKKAFAYKDVSNPDSHTHFITTIGNVAYDLDLNAKTYSENTNNYVTFGLVAQKTAIASVISGKYYQGADHVYGVLTNGDIVYFEWVIKDGLILEINQFINLASGEFNYGYINQTFVYDSVNVSDFPSIPTSLDGYTAQ